MVVVYDLIFHNSELHHIPWPVALEQLTLSERKTNNGELYVL